MVAERKGQPGEDPQAGMFDHVIEDEGLEKAISQWIELAPQRKELAGVSKALKDAKERIGIGEMKDGERVRCGRYTFEVKARSGGDFQMPAWETVGFTQFRPLVSGVD